MEQTINDADADGVVVVEEEGLLEGCFAAFVKGAVAVVAAGWMRMQGGEFAVELVAAVAVVDTVAGTADHHHHCHLH